MNTHTAKFRNFLSTWFLTVFVMGLVISALFTEFFQNNSSKHKVQSIYDNPIRADILANIKTIIVKNRLGDFTLTREKNHWMLKEPRQMPAKNSSIDKIVQSLESISVKNIHQYEPINLSSFSLDRPLIKLSLYTKLDEQITLNFGLFNPVNETTYMTVSNIKTIYQVDALPHNLEAMGLTDLIDSSIFQFTAAQISKFNLYRGVRRELLHTFENKLDGWKSSRYNAISNINTNTRIEQVLSIKPHHILDQVEEEAQAIVETHLKNPLYTLEITTMDGNHHSYTISSLISKPLPGIKIQPGQDFIISSSDHAYNFLLSKDELKVFEIRYQDIR